ncbi:MAG: hypothetical protein ACRDTG_08630 [Pseudonocardiaceae bacterium]
MSEQEYVKPNHSRRDWRVGCYDAIGKLTTCIIDTDHATMCVGVGVCDTQDWYFELRGQQVGQFHTALSAATQTLHNSQDQSQHVLACYNTWGELRVCSLETAHGVLRISCVDLLDKQQCFVELRDELIDHFTQALDEAMEIYHADVALYGQYCADVDQTSPPSRDLAHVWPIDATAPRTFLLCEDTDKGPVTIARGLSFSRDDQRAAMFSSAENARHALSSYNNIRLIWTDEHL